MKTVDEKKKFIELKAQGLSLSKISDELNISKPTLVKWSQEYKKEIKNLLYLQFESIINECQLEQSARIESMAKILRKALDELNSRSFADLNIKDLISIIEQTSEKLRKEFLPVQYILDETIDSRSEWEEEVFPQKTLPFPY